MRTVNLIGMFIIGVGLVVVAPAIITGQPGGFGKKGGGGGFGADPNTIFDFLARGRNFFLISESRSQGALLAQFAQEKGITNGQITRQQYLEFYDWRQKQAPAAMTPGGGGFGKQGFGGPGAKISFGGSGMQPPGGAQGTPPTPDMIAQFAELEFKRYDRNGDGVLNQEEMPPPLRRDLAKWDKNGDGVISLPEFKDYFNARMQGQTDDSGRNGPASIIIEEEDLDRKPVVFRAGGKMPAGLPAWFKELDTDGDGQVALYEWRKAGKSMEEFTNWDLNGDGFITPDEALKQQSVLAKTGTKDSSGASLASSTGGDDRRNMKWGKGPGGDGNGSGAPVGKGGFGGFPGFGKSKKSNKGSGDQ